MTISASQPIRVVYRGDGVTVNFSLPFVYFANEDGTKQLLVVKADSTGLNATTLAENTDFTITAAGEPNGTLTLFSALEEGKKLTIVYDIPIEQPINWAEFARLPSKSIETSFDRVVAILKQHQEILERCVKVVVSDDQTPEELLGEVYDKLDSATEIADDARAAANEATTAANNATAAVASAEDTLADVKTYVDNAKTNINETITIKVAETIEDAKTTVTAAATTNVNNYVDETVKPALQNYTDSAAGSAVAAENSASAAAGSAASAAASEVSASNSAQSATAAKQAAEAAITDENLVIVATDLKSASSNIKSVAANKTNINTVAGNKTNINTVAGDKANIDAVAANKANIDTVAENSAAVNNVASNMADVKAAVKSASDAKKWAVGTIAEQPDGSAKYWAEQAQSVTQVADASETAKGIARIATDAEVGAGTDDNTIVTPKKLKAKYASLAGAIFTGLLRIIKSGTVLEVRNTSYPTQNVLPETAAYSSITFNSMDGNYFTLIDTQMGVDGASYARFIHKNPFKNKSTRVESNVYVGGNSELKLIADAVTLEASKVTVPTVATNVRDKQAASTAWVYNWIAAQNSIGVTITSGASSSTQAVSLKTRDNSLDIINDNTITKKYIHDSIKDKAGKDLGYSTISYEGAVGKSEHSISAISYKEDGSPVVAQIGVQAFKTGEIKAFAPTPSENSNDTDIANTGWVTVFRYSINAISATSGSINLEVTRVYKMTVTGTTTFVLPATPVADKHNQIKLMLKVTGTPTINWGTTNFFNKQTPDITEGYYDVYFDYDPNLAAWVCGVMAKGAEDNA